MIENEDFGMREKHYTASVFLLTLELPVQVVLVKHKKINKWLPPGGHQEPGESCYETAIRETREETGIDISNFMPEPRTLDERSRSLPIPAFILEEKIEANENQGEHIHLDMVYVVRVPYQNIIKSDEESEVIGWFKKEEVETLETVENVRILLNEILEKVEG